MAQPGVNASGGANGIENADAPDMSHMKGDLYEKGEGAAFVEHEKKYLDSSRWWFASTIFPLLASTFGPMASAFSICALVQEWRAHLSVPGWHLNQTHETKIKDPSWYGHAP